MMPGGKYLQVQAAALTPQPSVRATRAWGGLQGLRLSDQGDKMVAVLVLMHVDCIARTQRGAAETHLVPAVI